MSQPGASVEHAKLVEDENPEGKRRFENSDMLANDRAEHSHGGSGLHEKSGVKDDNSYEAPLIDSSTTEFPRVPGSYIVTLRADHSVAQHLEIIGFDITPYGGKFYDRQGGCTYGAELTNKQLDAVRKDPGVKSVTVDTSGEDESLEDDEDESD